LMAFLYLNSHGNPHYKHSFSAGLDFDNSPLRYKLRRIDGWREKDTKASLLFGRCLESAIQFHHENNGKGAFSEFTRLWKEHQNNTEIIYTKTEGNWESLNRAGQEMTIIYTIRQPALPIPLQSVFQREYEKEVFPGHPDFGGITDAGKLDIICRVDPKHSMLPAVIWSEDRGMFRTLIVDIKTGALDFDDRQGMCAFDGQLRHYSWLTGIQDVGFLWFKKARHNLSKGSSVTLLANSFLHAAGSEAVVAQVIDGHQAYIVGNDLELEAMEATQGRKPAEGDKLGALLTTNDAKARKAAWLEENADLVDVNTLSRQRLQFNAGIVSPESAADAGNIAGRQITEIVNAWKNNQWTNSFGVRFPKDSRDDPYFKAFVLKDELFKSRYFKKSDDDTFDDLLVTDDPEDGQ
ncbi:MAG: hypothetical protein ACREQ5_17455, partial [Candidatus Dormibacteria bacterium]